jgi:4-amino-4-deoxy-L-arabinose transferase-like glycosyltransferase
MNADNVQIKNTYFFEIMLVVVFCVLLFAIKVPHLTGPIDDPYSWRQCDTAQYARDFYENGINLMLPSVCWMGNYRHVLLEFPLPEMLMAILYNIFGYHLFLSRLITLAFFVGASIYLFLIMGELTDIRLASITTCVYTVLPLSQFYSRAIHIDFFAVFFSHAMFFYLIRMLHQPRMLWVVLSIALGTLSFLVKAPYAFYFSFPLFYLASKTRSIKSCTLLFCCFLIMVLPFYFWRIHVDTVNAAAPDWFFIPGYYKFINMNNWYYGPFSMRTDLRVWRVLLERFQHNVVSDLGVWLFLFGCIISIYMALKGRYNIKTFWLWFVGTFVYVAIFFNLNYIHDYYQIPLLGISAVFIAIAIDAPRQMFGQRFQNTATILSFAILVILTVGSVSYAKHNYFIHDKLSEKTGLKIAQTTPANALIIIASEILDGDPRDPRILFRAGRYGWSIHKQHLSRDIIERLKKEGATHLAIVKRVPNNLREAYNFALLQPFDKSIYHLGEPNDLKGAYGFAVDSYSIGEEDWMLLIADLSNQNAIT